MTPQHFLLVCMRTQSHIIPLLRLGRKLTSFGARVTFSTTVSAHRRMFPGDQDGAGSIPFDDQQDQLLSYHPYSDGYDDGAPPEHAVSAAEYYDRSAAVGSETLYAVATAAATATQPAGRSAPPITCVIYAIIAPWAAGVARRLRVPSVLFWIQPASLFAVYYHYFHDYRATIDEIIRRKTSSDLEDDDGSNSVPVEIPGLPALHFEDLPSIITGGSGCNSAAGPKDATQPSKDWSVVLLRSFEHSFRVLDEELLSAADENEKTRPPKVLVNTFHALEADVIQALSKAAELVPIGPMLPSDLHAAAANIDSAPTAAAGASALLDGSKEQQDSNDHKEWLSRWPDRSVVYLSFGSLSQLGRDQVREFAKGLVGCGRPFFWILRGDVDVAIDLKESLLQPAMEKGRTAEWCDQVQVLQHPAVGCFVTHCGWNSITEAIVAGVPMIATPIWSDQPTNARLMMEKWHVGVTAKTDGGLARAEELQRCIELVMEDDPQGATIRKAATEWKEKARQAIDEGGSSDRNLKSFVDCLRQASTI